MIAIDRPSRWGAWSTGAALTIAALGLAGLNAADLGGLDALLTAWRDLAAAPLTGVELAHAWLPRLVIALIAGAALAAAGTVMQQVLRNPIASPLTLGVAAGAQLALSVLTLAAPAALA